MIEGNIEELFAMLGKLQFSNSKLESEIIKLRQENEALKELINAKEKG